MQTIKNLILPVAIILGFFFHEFFAKLGNMVPYLIFCMLFITYCDLHLKNIRIGKFHISMLLFQIITGVTLYFSIQAFNLPLAQGLMVTALVPTATAAVVVAGMLGADIGTMTIYTLICNVAMAVICPLVFSFAGNVDGSLGITMLTVFRKVFPLLILPLLLALFLKRIFPKTAHKIVEHKYISFYIWSVSLTIVIGRTINDIFTQSESQYSLFIIMTTAALLLCILQFAVGKRIGKRYGDIVAGGQAVGQKNTVLAIWMAQTFLAPMSSLVPAMYIIWQNLYNSYQIWQKNKKEKTTK